MLNRLWLRLERWFLYQVIRLFRIRGQSERVARGFALGLIVNFFPTFGFGVLISGFIARMLGGNAIAGFVGGATLTFIWPLLFYLNVRLGSYFVNAPVIVEELDDVTPRTVNALVWGQTFMVGAILNSIIIGLSVYLLLRLLYTEVRPSVLAYFRNHSRDHQLKFRRRRNAVA